VHAHLGLLVESVNLGWYSGWPEMLTRLPNLQHVDRLKPYSNPPGGPSDRNIRPTLDSLVAFSAGDSSRASAASNYFDLHLLRRLDYR
jgi:hypothetical protein